MGPVRDKKRSCKENYSNKVKELHKLTTLLSYMSYNGRFKAFLRTKILREKFSIVEISDKDNSSFRGLFDVVNGITKQPATDAAGYATWNILNSKGNLISSGIEYEQLQTVIGCQTAPEMWHKLKTIHEQRSAVSKLQLKQQFFNYRMLETDSIAKHLSKIDAMAQALTEVGEITITEVKR